MATGNIEYAVFPMEVMNITTKMNEGTHVGSYAIDIAGRDTKIESAFAPFTGVIKKIWNNGNSVWLESVAPVELADGSIDYLTVLMTHDNDVRDLYVGKVIDQGVNFYQEGTAGNATGNHIHLNVGRGKFTGTGWFQNKYGYWVINNEIIPYDAFYLSGTQVINGANYPWKTKGEDMSTITKEQEQVLAQGVTGSNPGKDYNYQFTGKESTQEVLDGLTSFWSAQAPTITKEQENAVADGISGIKGYIGWDKYNSQFVGKKIVDHYPAMVDFWIKQKPKSQGEYVPYTLPNLYVKK